MNKQTFLRQLHKKLKDLDIPRSSRYEKALVIIGRISYPIGDDDETWLIIFQILCKLSDKTLVNTSKILYCMCENYYSQLQKFDLLITPLMWKAFGNDYALDSLISIEYRNSPYKQWLIQIASQLV